MKKVLAFALAFLCVAPLLTTAATVGDPNADGIINSLDASTVLKHDALLSILEGEALYNGDVNLDGKVDSLDAAFILRYDAGLDVEGSALPSNGDGIQLSIEGCALSHADYISIDDIYATSLDGRGLFRFDSTKELQAFRNKYNEYDRFTYGYDEVPSFDSVIEGYDDNFFNDHCLILKYIQSAGSDRYTIYDLRWFESKKRLVLYYGDVKLQLWETGDMNGFFVTVPVLKSDIEGCTGYSTEYCIPVEIYSPDESWNSFVIKESLFDGTERGLAVTLEREGCIPDGSVMNSFDVRNGIAYVDMNEAFAEGVSAGTFTEYFYVGCLVNTLLDYDYLYDSYNAVMITVNGKPMVTDHVGEWTEPLGYYTGIGDLDGLIFSQKRGDEALTSDEETNGAMLFMRTFLEALHTGDTDTCNAMVTEKFLDMAEIYRIDKNYIEGSSIAFLPSEEQAEEFGGYTLPDIYKFSYYEDQDAAIRTGEERHVLFQFEFYKGEDYIATSKYVFDIVFEENGDLKVNNFGEHRKC